MEKQNRIRISLPEIRRVISWIKIEAGAVECLATPGPTGGIQIEPATSQDALRRRFTDSLSGDLPQSSDAGEHWIEAARLLATVWKLSISIDENRANIPLQEPLRKGMQLPGYPGRVVVFAFGGILELWDAPKWYEHIRALSVSRESRISEAIEHLESR